jgi:ATP-dependent Clp protease protease subunit
VTKRVSAKPTKQKEKQKKKKSSAKEDINKTIIVNNIQLPKNESSEVRTINLYGDITEKVGAEVVSSLLYLQSTAMVEVMPEDPEDPEDPENTPVTLARSIEIYVSTHGGTASDMFSIIDVMESIKKNTCDIETLGIGKVMSAGVPILAAGTPGKRKIGKNCRVMLHSVMAGTGGTIFSMENELEEIKWIQDSYIKCLAGYTKMTPARIRKILKTQKDFYFSAQEAIKMGIADKII